VLANGGDPPPPDLFHQFDPPYLIGDLIEFALARQYRVMAHLSATHDGTTVQIRGTPLAMSGLTKDPCTGWRLPGLSETELHPDHGAYAVRSENAFVLTEARVGILGQRMDQVLNCPTCALGQTTPWIWGVIRVDPSGILNPGGDIVQGGVDHQIFPTYTVYKDGVKLFSSVQSHHEDFIALDETSERREGEIP
jgi:hypothetical protein